MEDFELDLTGRRKDDPVPGYALRLRPATRFCAVMAGTVVAFAILDGFLIHRTGGRPVPGLPPSVPLALSLLAAVLILLSSRIRSSILRRAFPRSAELSASPETVLAAYARAARASFALLVAAALLGLGVSLTTGAPLYGIVLCAASLFGMLTRWPQGSEVDRLLRGRARP
ncbi:MAG TPA: hypothetical protein VGH73_24080 [Thermoanaerobaculia bacterium]